MLGFSARDSAMAGATTASAKDTSCLVKNPAGLIYAGNRIDAEYLNIIFHDVKMDTEGQPAGHAFSLSEVGRRQKSTQNYLPGMDAGISYRVPGDSEHPIAVGLGIFTMAGMAVDFPASRANEIVIPNSAYDRKVDLRSLRIAPGVATKLMDNLAFGATLNIAIQGLRTDLARTDFKETNGSNKWDTGYGGGLSAGLLYKLNEKINLGASYESQTWGLYHHKYKDVLYHMDQPSVANVGISFKPTGKLELTYDTRYIRWTDVKTARLKPAEGGFGWRNQWVFALGSEYSCNKRLKLRLGYNYGRSPIPDDVIFANALFPVIVEHHATMGFSYMLKENLSLDFSWEHHFLGASADNGKGDIYSQNGVGTKITGAADIVGIGLGYTF